MQSHSAKTPSVCKLRPTPPTFLSLSPARGERCRRESRRLPLGTDSTQDTSPTRFVFFSLGKKQEQSLPTTQRKEKVKIFSKAVFLNSLLAQGGAEPLLAMQCLNLALLLGHGRQEKPGAEALFALIQPGHPFVQPILSPERSDQLFKFPQMLAANLQPFIHFRH